MEVIALNTKLKERIESMSSPQLIVTKQKSFAWYVYMSIILLALLLLSFYAGSYFSITHKTDLQVKVQDLQQELSKYQRAYAETNKSLVIQTQSAKVDNQSNQQLVKTVKQLQESQRQLTSELKFYRNIMAPELDRQGLTIADFDLGKTEKNRSFSFKLVLTQAGRQEQFLKGEATIQLHGKLAGKQKTYNFRELGAFQKGAFKFQFRYFQNIEGDVTLPKDFVAENVTVQVRTRGLSKNQTAEKQVNWDV